MSSFFQKARERAQEAAAQFQQQHHNGGAEDIAAGTEGGATKRNSFTYTGSIPHLLRHGMASVDPRHEYNRSFHLLSGKIKALRIDYDGMARETKGVATATCRWGQDQLPENREDGAGDEALSDLADRLAYIFSLVGEAQTEHSKRIEASRAELKRIQKAESGLAPKRAARIKLHKELMMLIPERAKVNSTKIAPLEAQLNSLEIDDKELEEQLGALKRDALKKSYDAHFDSMIELSEKLALLARYGKLMTTQLPVYPQPFPTPRHVHRGPEEETWPGEAKLAAIRAAVEPALQDLTPDYSLPEIPNMKSAKPLSKRQTIRFSESHKLELEEAIKEEEDDNATALISQDSTMQSFTQDSTVQSFKTSPPILPMGGSLPPNLNLGPSPIGIKSGLGATSPNLPPRNLHEETSTSSQFSDGATLNPASASIADSGPTLAETGSPIMSSHGGPGPLTGQLSPRPRTGSIFKGSQEVGLTTSVEADTEAKREKAALEQQEVLRTATGARIRRDGTVVRKGDADYREDLPPYHE